MTNVADGRVRLDRREFLKRFIVGGVGVALLPLPSFGADTFELPAARSGIQNGRPRWRVDGYPKVTGAKLYPIDFRASDMPGWPARTSHAMLMRARDVTHVFAGVDLSELEPSLRPDRMVLAGDLVAAKLRARPFTPETCYAPSGRRRLIWASRSRS